METIKMKITPISIKEFAIESQVSDDNLANDYWEYLVNTKHMHHYNGKGMNAWYREQMSSYPWKDAYSVLLKWLDSGYTKEDVLAWKGNSEMIDAIYELGFESKATMHHDDPSLIELHAELDQILEILR